MSRQPAKGSGFALGCVTIFHGVAPDRLEQLSQQCSWYLYAKGTEIIAQQEPGREVYFIASGAVRVLTSSAAGRQVRFQDLHSGEFFGDVAAVDGGPRSASVTALVESLVAVLPAAGFIRLLHEQPVVHEHYLRDLMAMLRRLTDRVSELSTLTVAHRVQAELLRLCPRSGTLGNACVIEPAPTHSQIADRVSTSREQVTRELSALSRRGVLRKKGKALVVTDLVELQRLIGECPATGSRRRRSAEL